MQLQHITQAPLAAGVEPSFLITLSTDQGKAFNVLASGRQLDRPLEFAAFAAAQTGEPCSSPVGSDVGTWHSLLGQVLSQREPTRGPSSNLAPVVEFTSVWMEEERRQELLAASKLGQTVPFQAAPVAEAPVAKEPAKSEHEQFLERTRAADADARRRRLNQAAVHLEQTSVGRDVLKQNGVR